MKLRKLYMNYWLSVHGLFTNTRTKEQNNMRGSVCVCAGKYTYTSMYVCTHKNGQVT